MYPILFRFGPFTIHAYGVALAVAFLLGVGLACQAVKHSFRGVVPMSETQLVDWACWATVGGIIGGRLFYVALNWQVYATRPLEILAIWHGGLVWYGGFVGAALVTWLYLKAHKQAFLRGADQVIPFAALGHAIGRIGCFANGCCYGAPTSAWFGVQFPGHPGPVVPTQLIESASLLGLYLILRALQRPSLLHRPGALFGIYLVGYGLIRFCLEFWRGDQALLWNGLTLHQLISLVLLVVGAGLLTRRAQGVAKWPSGQVAK